MSNEEQVIIKTVIQRLQELSAVETLEYHNKNGLALDDARRSEEKINQFQNLINKLKTIL